MMMATRSEDSLIQDTSALLSGEGRKILASLYATMRSLRLYPLENQVVQRALAEVEANARVSLNREGRMQLRLAGDFVFFNEQLASLAASATSRPRPRETVSESMTTISQRPTNSCAAARALA